MSKPTVWRWLERYIDEGIPGLKRDKARPSRVPPLPMETRLRVIANTVQESPPNATHRRRCVVVPRPIDHAATALFAGALDSVE